MSSDLFAPPTQDELASAKDASLFAPPTDDEIQASGNPKPDPTMLEKAGSAALHGISAAGDSGNAALDEVGRGVPILGPATVKAGHGLAAFLTRITPDSVLPESLRGKTIGELYDHFKQQDDQTEEKLMAEHPFASRVGQVAGSLTAPMPGAGMSGLAGAATRIAGVAGVNAGDAAMRGEDPLKAAKVGGGIAAGLEALPVVGKLVRPVAGNLGDLVEGGGNALRSLGEEKAFKAAAGNQAKAYKLAGDKVNDIGRELLDKDVVSFGASPATIHERAGEQADQAWDRMKGAMDQADQAVPAGAVSGTDIAQAIRANAQRIGGKGNESTVAKLEDAAQYYEAMGDAPLSQSQVEKNSWDYKPGDDFNANNIVKGAIGEAMETGVQRAGGQPAADYVAGKKTYGAMTQAGNAAEVHADRLAKNNSFSLGDKAAAGAGMLLNPHGTAAKVVTGAITGGINKVVRARGNAALAVTADNLGSLLQKMPELAQKFGGQLTSAASRGNQALAVTHYMLSQQDPEYQRLFSAPSLGDDDE